jgi:predicted P-loop ATPase
MFCEDLAVAPDLFTDTSVLAGTAKEQIEAMGGKDVIELGEMAGLHPNIRARIKAFITRKVDRARMSYDRYALDVKRRGVPIGTTNVSKYLSDPTGERRWWPIAVIKYEREAFLRDKEQLYAEAIAAEPNENIWLDSDDLIAAHDALTATRKEENELVELLSNLRGARFGKDGIEERVSSKAVRNATGAADVDVLRIRNLGTLLGEAMTILGWTKAESPMVCHVGMAPERGYRRPWVERPEPDEEIPF